MKAFLLESPVAPATALAFTLPLAVAAGLEMPTEIEGITNPTLDTIIGHVAIVGPAIAHHPTASCLVIGSLVLAESNAIIRRTQTRKANRWQPKHKA